MNYNSDRGREPLGREQGKIASAGEIAGAWPRRPAAEAFVAAVGRLVRLGRAKRGMTRRQLAQLSGASERYLAQIEGGEGNPSVIVLKSIAEALDVPIIELFPRAHGRTAALNHILDLLGRMPRSELRRSPT